MSENPLRVAHVTATFPPYRGGAGTVASEHATRLAQRGHHVEVFTAESPGVRPATPAEVHRLRPLIAIGNAPLLPRLLRLKGFDVIHLHYPFIFGTEELLVSGARGTPLLLNFHNELIADGARGALFRAYERTVGRAALARADLVCAVSSDHAESVAPLRRLGSVSPHKLVELPNGVDIDAFSPRADREALRTGPCAHDKGFLVAFVGGLDRAHRFKRLDLLLEAAARLDASVRVVVVGDGDERTAHEQHAAALGLGDRVHFVGALDHAELAPTLAGADLLVLPSDPPESFGVVLVEAMACGVPAVVTDLPGPRTVVDDGVTGFVVARADAGALAAGIERVRRLSAPERLAMSEASRRRAVLRYGWDAIIDRLEGLYRDLVAVRSAAS